jgi:hypothetical protein
VITGPTIGSLDSLPDGLSIDQGGQGGQTIPSTPHFPSFTGLDGCWATETTGGALAPLTAPNHGSSQSMSRRPAMQRLGVRAREVDQPPWSSQETQPWNPGFDSTEQRNVAVLAEAVIERSGQQRQTSTSSMMCKHKACNRQLFVSEEELEAHNTTVEYAKKHQYKCEVCENHKGHRYKKDLRRHMLKHEEPEFPCTLCGRSFYRQDHRDRHMGVYGDPSQWSNPVCDSLPQLGRTVSDAGSRPQPARWLAMVSVPSSEFLTVDATPAMRRSASDASPRTPNTRLHRTAMTPIAQPFLSPTLTSATSSHGPSSAGGSFYVSSSRSEASYMPSRASSLLPLATPLTIPSTGSRGHSSHGLLSPSTDGSISYPTSPSSPTEQRRQHHR